MEVEALKSSSMGSTPGRTRTRSNRTITKPLCYRDYDNDVSQPVTKSPLTSVEEAEKVNSSLTSGTQVTPIATINRQAAIPDSLIKRRGRGRPKAQQKFPSVAITSSNVEDSSQILSSPTAPEKDAIFNTDPEMNSKGRGRPKLRNEGASETNLSLMDDCETTRTPLASDTDATPNPDSQTKPRGRGRPPMHKQDSPSSCEHIVTSVPSVGATVKTDFQCKARGRGRPKVVKGDSVESTYSAAEDCELTGTVISNECSSSLKADFQLKQRGRGRSMAPEDDSLEATPAANDCDLPGTPLEGNYAPTPNTNSPPKSRGRGRPRKHPLAPDEGAIFPEQVTPVAPKRGRKLREDATETDTDPNETVGSQENSADGECNIADISCDLADREESQTLPATSATTKRGRKRKMTTVEEEASPKTRVMKIIGCGVCHKQIPESNFHYHRYSVHLGLARAEGMSQEFTEAEKKSELRKAIIRLKKIACPLCGSSFTTVPGYVYHAARCGVAPDSSVEKKLFECTVCGKKVMILKAHMKIHEREAAREEMDRLAEKESLIAIKSKRVAAVKAATLLSEIGDDAAEPTPKISKKLEKLYVEPPSSKATNSIICAWKRQISNEGIARCRHPGCTFSSTSLDELKEHHVQCEIGAKLKTFVCVKCDFRCAQKSDMVSHAVNTHVSEKDAMFEVDSDCSDEDAGGEDDLDDEEFSDEEKSTPKKSVLNESSVTTNSRFPEKIYGLTTNELVRFKTHPTSPLIPKWLAQYHAKHFTWNGSLYDEWRPSIQELVDPDEYLPSWKQSLPFHRRKITNNDLHPPVADLAYEHLKRFQGKLFDETPVFFGGGPIQCSAWCPMPYDSVGPHSRAQYLALSTFHDEHRFRGAAQSSFAARGAIQLWNCGPLRNAEAPTAVPHLDLCLAHDYGRVWDLEWCSSGCYDEARLGILAVAFSDGAVRVFPIPQPAKLLKSPERFPVYTAEPSLTLRFNISDQSECTCLHWDSTKGHRFIAAGFGNGMIGLWDLQTKSVLLRNGRVLHPVWSFYGHSSTVTAISLSPHHTDARFMASSSTDRTLKLWDRFDSRVPVSCTKRARITSIQWRKHWPGVLITVEDVYALFRSSTMHYDFGYTNNKQTLLPQNSVVWSATENEYLDVIAHATAAGEVVIYHSHMAINEPDDKKLRRTRCMVFRTDMINMVKVTPEQENTNLNQMKKVYLTPQNSKKQVRRKESPQVEPKTKKYAVVFNDVATVRSLGKQTAAKSVVSELMDIAMPDDDPIAAIKKIAYNPNFECHSWMCLCGENGLVQLLRLDSQVTPKADDIYRKEINDLTSTTYS